MSGTSRLASVLAVIHLVASTASAQEPAFPMPDSPPPKPADKPVEKPADAPGEKPASTEKTAPEVIPVSDTEKIKTLMGRTAVVKGKVSRVEALKTGTVRVYFEKAECILYIRKAVLTAHPDWKPGELNGKEVFAAGSVADYKGRPELVVERPSQVSQSLEQLDHSTGPAKKAAPGEKGDPATPDAASGPTFKPQSAAVGQLRAVTDVAQPYVAYERFQAAAERGSRGTGAPITLESFSGKDRSPALAGLDVVRAARGWPRATIVRVKRAGGNPGPGLPLGSAVALMLESMAEDLPVPENFAVLGTMAPNGTITGGADELLLLAKAQAPENLVVAAPATAENSLFDVAMDGDWAAFCRYPLLEASDLTALKKLARDVAGPEFAGTVAPLAEIRAALVKSADGALRSAALKAKLDTLLKARPDLLNARVLQKIVAGQAPKTWSSATTGAKLRAFYQRAAAEAKGLKSAKESDAPKKTIRALKEDFAKITARKHPDWSRFHQTLADWVEALEDSLRFDSKDTSAKAKKNADLVKTLTEKAKNENDEAAKMKL